MNTGKVLRSLTLRRNFGRLARLRRAAAPRSEAAAPLGVRRGEAFEHVVTVTVPADVARTAWRRLYPKAPDRTHAAVAEAPDGSLGWKMERAGRPHAAGKISFEPMSHGRGTVVRLRYASRPPGAVGKVLRRVTPGSPWRELRHALFRMKHVAETGEIPTTRHQPTGEGRKP